MGLLNNFNARNVTPQVGIEPVPDNWYKVVIMKSNIVGTNAGDGGMLKLELPIIEGPMQGRTLFWNLNLFNKSQQACEIAYKQLSAICHVVGYFQDLNETNNPDAAVPPLHNIPFYAHAIVKQGERGPMNEIRGVRDVNGVEPGKAPQQQGGGQPFQQPQGGQPFQQPGGQPQGGQPNFQPQQQQQQQPGPQPGQWQQPGPGPTGGMQPGNFQPPQQQQQQPPANQWGAPPAQQGGQPQQQQQQPAQNPQQWAPQQNGQQPQGGNPQWQAPGGGQQPTQPGPQGGGQQWTPPATGGGPNPVGAPWGR